MKRVRIIRTETGPDGTFGTIATGTFEAYTLERPAIGDHPCIMAGTYLVEWRTKMDHPIHGPCYEVLKVRDRSAILIHSANWASELLGCLSLGRSIGDVEKKDGAKAKGVTSSKDAIFSFEDDLDRLPFELVISWAPGVTV